MPKFPLKSARHKILRVKNLLQKVRHTVSQFSTSSPSQTEFKYARFVIFGYRKCQLATLAGKTWREEKGGEKRRSFSWKNIVEGGRRKKKKLPRKETTTNSSLYFFPPLLLLPTVSTSELPYQERVSATRKKRKKLCGETQKFLARWLSCVAFFWQVREQEQCR